MTRVQRVERPQYTKGEAARKSADPGLLGCCPEGRSHWPSPNSAFELSRWKIRKGLVKLVVSQLNAEPCTGESEINFVMEHRK